MKTTLINGASLLCPECGRMFMFDLSGDRAWHENNPPGRECSLRGLVVRLPRIEVEVIEEAKGT